MNATREGASRSPPYARFESHSTVDARVGVGEERDIEWIEVGPSALLAGVVRDHLCRMPAWRAHHASSRMRAGAAQIQALDRCSVSRPSLYRSQKVQLLQHSQLASNPRELASERVRSRSAYLIETHRVMEDVAAREAEHALQVRWRENVGVQHRLAEARTVLFDRAEHCLGKVLTRSLCQPASALVDETRRERERERELPVWVPWSSRQQGCTAHTGRTTMPHACRVARASDRARTGSSSRSRALAMECH